MFPQDEAGSLPFPFPLFLSDLPALHSKLKRPSDSKTLPASDETAVPSKFRCVRSCTSDFTKGGVPQGDLAMDGKYAVISRRSWDWESKGTSTPPAQTANLERHFSQVTDSSFWIPEKRTQRSIWAGPTLMDIESALATMPPVTSPLVSPKSSTSTRLVQSSPREGLNEGTSAQQTPHDSTDAAPQQSRGEDTARPVSRKNEETNEPAGAADLDKEPFLTTKVQRRTVPEARYTMKVRSEADNVEDGYRWRKYGQKFIKSNVHPRSYYRCTDARCQVKKQVERSSTESGILEVSYEGIHLHHRPYALTSSLRLQSSDQQETTVFAEDEHQVPSPSATAGFLLPNKPDLRRPSEKSADWTPMLEYFKLQLAASNQPPQRRPTAWLTDSSISNASCSLPSHPNRGLLQDLLPPSFINQ